MSFRPSSTAVEQIADDLAGFGIPEHGKIASLRWPATNTANAVALRPFMGKRFRYDASRLAWVSDAELVLRQRERFVPNIVGAVDTAWPDTILDRFWIPNYRRICVAGFLPEFHMMVGMEGAIGQTLMASFRCIHWNNSNPWDGDALQVWTADNFRVGDAAGSNNIYFLPWGRPTIANPPATPAGQHAYIQGVYNCTAAGLGIHDFELWIRWVSAY